MTLTAPYSSFDPFQSQILTGNQPINLINLCKFNLNDKWSLLYRGTRDGFQDKDFPSKCDEKPSTLTILKSKKYEFSFGGYTEAKWSSLVKFETDPNSFVFSLANKENRQCKIKTIFDCFSIYSDASRGYGLGVNDIFVTNNANKCYSHSHLGSTYKHPQHAAGSHEAKSFMAGLEYFQLSEIEVYKKE